MLEIRTNWNLQFQSHIQRNSRCLLLATTSMHQNMETPNPSKTAIFKLPMKDRLIHILRDISPNCFVSYLKEIYESFTLPLFFFPLKFGAYFHFILITTLNTQPSWGHSLIQKVFTDIQAGSNSLLVSLENQKNPHLCGPPSSLKAC